MGWNGFSKDELEFRRIRPERIAWGLNGLDWDGPDWIGGDRNELDWFGLGRIGTDWIGFGGVKRITTE